jgi:hypothetical protein
LIQSILNSVTMAHCKMFAALRAWLPATAAVT